MKRRKPQPKWLSVRSKDQKVFRARGKDVKKFDAIKVMREAAKRKARGS